MGKNLADFIEQWILGKFATATGEYILMRRNDLAIELSCAPSQISYVLNTRFTPERGFVVKSRRGAGGFVRIVRLGGHGKNRSVSETRAALGQLIATKALSGREHALLNYFLECAENFGHGEEASLLREALRRMEENS
jgi:transcriptional regulator CtsR